MCLLIAVTSGCSRHVCIYCIIQKQVLKNMYSSEGPISNDNILNQSYCYRYVPPYYIAITHYIAMEDNILKETCSQLSNIIIKDENKETVNLGKIDKGSNNLFPKNTIFESVKSVSDLLQSIYKR